jgi:hypothetical protein
MHRSLPSVVATLMLAGSAAGQIVLAAPDAYPLAGAAGARGIALGDVDGDGALDVVACSADGVELLAGLGDGTLTAPTPATAAGALRVLLADLDLDGALDLLVADGSAGWHAGHGDGTFDATRTVLHAPPSDVLFLAAADLSGDGWPDVVVSSGSLFAGSPRVDVLPSVGGGRFGAAQTLATPLSGTLPGRPHVADLDADGLLDVVVGHTAPGSSYARVWLGTGGGAFGPPTSYFGGTFFEVADATGDGVPDLVLAASTAAGVRPGLGDGTFGPVLIATDEALFGDLVVADLDGDDVPDLAAASLDSGDLRVLRGLGAGAFAPAVTVTGLELPGGLEDGDLDGDGRPDLVAGRLDDPGAVKVVLNHAYGAGSPFADLGHALGWTLAGDDVVPIQLADGTLAPGQPMAFRLENALHDGSATAWFVVGAAPLLAPFKGGTLVPDVGVVFGPFAPVGGEATLAGPMPPGLPSGAVLWTQWWIAGVDGPAGFGASTGVRATVP